MNFQTQKQQWENFYSKKLKEFTDYLDWIEKRVKEGKLDEAWYIANRGLVELPDDTSFMMYYQMSQIRKRERNFRQALFLFGLCMHCLGGLGGVTHDKYLDQLLKKLGLEDKKDELLKVFVSQSSEGIKKYLNNIF